MNELLTCPFCESDLTILDAIGDLPKRVRHETNTGCPLCSKTPSFEWWQIRTIDPRLEKVLKELESREDEFEKVFYGIMESPNKRMPREYWEGLVSGLKSTIICLWRYFPELKKNKS